MVKMECFLPEIRNNESISTLTTSNQYFSGVLSHVISQEKEMKGIQVGKDEVNQCLHADIITYVGYLKESTKKVIGPIKVLAWKVNV